MPRYQLTRRLLQQALERSGVLPEGSHVMLQTGQPDDPVLTVQYEVQAETSEDDLVEIHTLTDARRYVLERRDDGVECPCCGRFVLVYRRKLNAGMALAFLHLVQIWLAEQRPVHAKEVCGPTSNRDFSQLKFWGLMTPVPKQEGQKGRTSGLWVPTEKGVLFGTGKIAVPSHRIHVSGEDATQGWSTSTLYIRDALPDGFDYDELMAEGRTS